jgi:hypothetical protein
MANPEVADNSNFSFNDDFLFADSEDVSVNKTSLSEALMGFLGDEEYSDNESEMSEGEREYFIDNIEGEPVSGTQWP